ncbi:hypothetical protein S7711_00549 [Stachybotrys chartarum IBT 7711]|uniref:RNA-dependent RNA polymerase n=1 Tax=Stachybotrys chartarum (strain CBS 109288 / IBT 7711) TaxID=1280523 RepID=A0A084ATP6_STACB|nr:hypothetical protein S7711_00549 [Stachybotrys chartarum IBT 7711]
MSSRRASPRHGPAFKPRNSTIRASSTDSAASNSTLQSRKYLDSTTKPAPKGWEKWPELTIKVHNLPPDVSISNLSQWFSGEGEIVWMDIYQGDHDNGSMSAKIRFDPPPKRPFWDIKPFKVSHPDQKRYPNGLILRVYVTNSAPQNWIVSPVTPKHRYPKRLVMPLKSLKLGCLIGPQAMAVRRSIGPSPDLKDLKMEVDVNFKRITIIFPVTTMGGSSSGSTKQFKVEMDVLHMRRAYYTSFEDSGCTLTLHLPFPPKYYGKMDNVASTMEEGSATWTARNAWFRASNVCDDRDEPLRHPVAFHNKIPDAGYMEIGSWTTFCLEFDLSSPKASESIEHLLTFLSDFNVDVERGKVFNLRTDVKAKVWTMLDHDQSLYHSSAMALLAQDDPETVRHLDFEVRYQLEVCISQGLLNEHTIAAEFLLKLADLGPSKARIYLEYLADRGSVLYDPMRLFDEPDIEFCVPSTRTPHYCALMRRAIITPTTIRFSTPTMEKSNRIIRKYSHAQDRFLRVQFVNESETDRISITHDQNYDDVWKRVLRTLFQGIRIGDRHYQFLAFGSSQLRQGGAYFFCPTEHLSCDDIRKWMGNFDHIKIVAKYAARVGQCFSTTREIRRVYQPHIHPIPDIERNGYCFTDGVGIVSGLLARMITEEMELDVFDEPTTFQFRMGGHKGVLVQWPDAKGMEVHVRQSQEKFTTGFNGLEIIKCARFATATLNRQTIIILECLGVPIQAFEALLDQQLLCYEKSLVDNSMAIDLLTKFVDENQITMVLAELLKADFRSSQIQEPFVLNVMALWRAWSLKLLKEKARIHVEKSAFVLGCVDETGTLRGHVTATEGSESKDIGDLPEIFLQITDSKKHQKTRVIEGICIIGRNPSLHPGDIRVVNAVNNPKLLHLKDVVVFPSTGDRPIPNMLSGGDLDGDDFFVMWEPSLLPEEWHHPPMNYNSATKPRALDREVNVNDLRNFFVKYLQKDVLPLIAHAHVALADKHGPKSDICLRLAELHSEAVDYPKTGEPVTFGHKLRASQWPHFMDKNKKLSYQSNKALGVIYNKLNRQSIEFRPDWEHDFDPRILKRFELDHDILKAARKVKSQYDTSVRRLLTQQRLDSEFELWTGFAMSRPVGSSDYKRAETLGHEFDVLKQRYREMCYEAAGGSHPEVLDRFVAAMYQITEQEVKIALYEHHRGPINEAGTIVPPRQLQARSMPLISFPWIFHWVMIRIALGSKYDHKHSILSAARRSKQVVSLGEGTLATAAADEERDKVPEQGPLGVSEIVETESSSRIPPTVDDSQDSTLIAI